MNERRNEMVVVKGVGKCNKWNSGWIMFWNVGWGKEGKGKDVSVIGNWEGDK